MVLTSEAQATRLRRAMLDEGFTEDDVPESGQYVSLPKCVPEPQRCPRVERSLLNDVAATMCMILISRAPWTDAIAANVWSSYTANLPVDEKQRIASKIAAAMASEPVLEYLRRKAEEKRGD